MSTQFFLLNDTLKPERLGWIEDLLKFYFLKVNPQSFLHATHDRESAFLFFLTGDALYSLQNPETVEIWERFCSLPSIKIVCDQHELSLRGINVEHLKVKNPEVIINHNTLALNGRPSFWKDVIKVARQHEQPIPSSIGYLHLVSSYMNHSSEVLLQTLKAIVESHASWDLYCMLDGVHITHQNQNPIEYENIGNELENLEERTEKRGLHGQIFCDSDSSALRGYCSKKGADTCVSTSIIRPVKIKNIDEIASEFRSNHIILSENCASLSLSRENVRQTQGFEETGKNRAPPVTIVITRYPYGSEYSSGALSLAIACASNDIPTRVIFIEDGVYALCGVHSFTNDNHNYKGYIKPSQIKKEPFQEWNRNGSMVRITWIKIEKKTDYC